MARRLSGVVKEIQSTTITDDEIFYLVDEMARTHREQQWGDVDLYTAIAILVDRYGAGDRRPFCIMERMLCFLPLLDDQRMRGWTIQGREENCVLTDAAVFRAIARCPIRGNSRRLWFDANEFFAIVLEQAEPVGSA